MNLNLSGYTISAQGVCEGGTGPDLSRWPLLVCVDGEVRTEDGKVSLNEIINCCKTGFGEIATKFGTTVEHVMQAIDYAIKAGMLA